MRRFRIVMMCMLLAGVSCKGPSILVAPDLTTSGQPDLTTTASPDLTGGGTDGGTSVTVNLTGTSAAIYHTDSADVVQPDDTTKLALAALAPLPGGGFTTVAATGKADGTFAIANIPASSFWLKLGADRFIWTSATQVDLSRYYLGRPDRMKTSISPTTVNLGLNNLETWQTGDDVELFSSNLGLLDTPLGYLDQGPAAGVTMFGGLTLDWSPAGGVAQPFLIDMTKGDRVILTQIAPKTTMTGLPYVMVTRSAALDPFSLTDGVTANLSAMFTDTAPLTSLPLLWKRSLFEGLMTAINPGVTGSYGQLLQVIANPGVPAYDAPVGPDLLTLRLSQAMSSAADVDLGTLTYRNPFPAGWVSYGTVRHQYKVNFSLPGAPKPGSVTASISVTDKVAGLSAGPIQPLISPVTRPTVNGQDAFSAQTGVGATPVLGWAAPAIGTQTGAVVTVYHVYVQTLAGASFVRVDSVATLYTRSSPITIPPGLLQAGQSYAFQIKALTQAGSDVSQTPFRGSLPRGTADLVTALVTP